MLADPKDPHTSITHYAHHTAAKTAGVPHSFATGELHVLRVRRVIPRPDTRASEEPVVTLQGVPASHGSKAHKAIITFVPDMEEVPEPILEADHGCIRLFYPMEEMREVMRVIRHRGERLCYFWRSRDERRMLAWLIAVP